jgi:GT2 family glycosyltransferase
MSGLPSVDVVILSWNRRDVTLDAIENVFAQRGVEVRICIVDQGSEKACLTALREAASDPRLDLVEMGRNLGVSGGRNIGMRRGVAPIVVCIDNDAVFADSGCLARAVARFDVEPLLGALSFCVRNFFTGRLDSWAYPRALKSLADQPFMSTRFSGGAHALRRRALEQTELYDDRLFFYWEEVDLSYQLIELGWTIAYDPRVVVRHKVSPEARMNWGRERFYFLVRNALYLDYKYFGSRSRLAVRAAGYFVKGLRNGVPRQVLRAFGDSLRMIRELEPDRRLLGDEARRYLHQHELRHRGGVLKRLRDEAWERMA